MAYIDPSPARACAAFDAAGRGIQRYKRAMPAEDLGDRSHSGVLKVVHLSCVRSRDIFRFADNPLNTRRVVHPDFALPHRDEADLNPYLGT
jgi:hypothetical protein